MKYAFSLLLCWVLVGCSDSNKPKLDRKDVAAYNAYWEAQSQRYERYESGSTAEAEQALKEIIAYARENRGKIKLYHGTENEVSLCFGRLAMIAESEHDSAAATNYWAAAVAANFQSQKDQLIWELSTPGIQAPNKKSSDLKTATPDAIRKFIKALETNKPAPWKK